MEKWTKEEVAEVIGALPLEHEIEVLNIRLISPEVVVVSIAGITSPLDLKIIGEAFGDEDVWVSAEGYELKLTIYIKEK